MLRKIYFALNLFLLSVAEAYASAGVVADKIPFKANDSDLGFDIQKVILVFLLIVILAYFLIYGLKIYYSKKFSVKNPANNIIKIADRRHLAKNLTVIILQVNEKQYTFAQTQNELIILEKKTINGNEEESNSEAVTDN